MEEYANLELSTPNVTITGGEPLVQMQDLRNLIETIIREYDHKISVETNGTLSVLPLLGLCSFVMDIKPPSSGMPDFVQYRNRALENAFHLTEDDWIKFPVQNDLDFVQALSEVRMLEEANNEARLAFSAVHPLTHKELLDWLFKEDLGDIVLNVQLHKIIGVA
jgi:organic radical activating enzyme